MVTCRVTHWERLVEMPLESLTAMHLERLTAIHLDSYWDWPTETHLVTRLATC